MTLQGRAAPQATATYAERMREGTARGHFRTDVRGVTVSSVGIGTYLGQPDDVTDAAYEAAVLRALASGVNHIDTAVNYRHQRSERAIGRALAGAVMRGDVRRDEVVIATKGGFVPFDGERPADAKQWVYEAYIKNGFVHSNEFVANYQHCLAPDFLDLMIRTSRANLGVETIDIYYLHNPETQRISNTHETFRRRMLDAFETLEAAVDRGDIAWYGLATWTAFRSPPTVPDYLSLTEMVGLAFQVAGDRNHLAYIQLPYNLMMTEAFALRNQQVGEEFMSAIDAAAEFGLGVVTSATLKQGALASPFMADLSPYFPEMATAAQRAIQFARSTPGVTSALVGMCTPAHVGENLATVTKQPTDPAVIRGLFPDE